MHPMLNIAVKAARRAGNIINRATRNLDIVAFQEKAVNDFVSEVDREAEQAIIRVLREAYPAHAILAEESGASGESEYQWIVDPLDGTTNFLHGIPQFAISIALERQGRLQAALVYDPLAEELFTAERGAGAFVNDRRLRVAARSNLADCVIATGMPYKGHGQHGPYIRELANIMDNVAGIRRFGAAALDLAWVAAGRFDGFWEHDLSPWDLAAGILLIREAGGYVTDLEGGDAILATGGVVAGNESVHGQLLAHLAG